MKSISTLLIVSLVLIAYGASAYRAENVPSFLPEQELLDELQAAPQDNVEREKKLRELYLQAGAQPEDITLQGVKTNNPHDPVLHNVIVTEKGETDAVIIVGGHLDKVSVGQGVIDNWSGATLAANLYQTLKPLKMKHTFVFIGFAYEERGLLGSRAYVASLSAEQKKRVKAMVNLECLGVDDPFIWTNGSTDSLEVIAHRVARENNLPLRDHVLNGVGTDSIPFEQAGIPNITFDGLAQENFRFIHSALDNFSNIKPPAYQNAYRLVTQFLMALDKSETG
ncbi:MAG: M28 family metallopeptidase [Abditibacteriales bacterium]|nr:M28 family metallopeptidase [Abditibacteriales bacterium]MDW8365942.1 DUF4910 domain-containing protein [Abditibacteriales bacterium]